MKKNCCDNHLTEEKAKELLASNGLNRTKTKTSLLVALSNSKTPLSATELHQELGDESCDISTIFRTIGQFKEKNIIKEINLGEDFFRYEIQATNNQQTHHHHHVRCRECGEIKLIEKCDMSIFDKMLSKMGYAKMEHYLEFTGICSKCS
ncbi:MAG: transcriptional repressor [Bdellovibrionales bacterium]|nr:transcriptional repressor [Bdellovibrionales bacterium]